MFLTFGQILLLVFFLFILINIFIHVSGDFFVKELHTVFLSSVFMGTLMFRHGYPGFPPRLCRQTLLKGPLAAPQV